MPNPPRGRGAAPSTKREDRDLQNYANKRVATHGPPSLQTFATRRGGGDGVGRGRGRGRGRGGAWVNNGGVPPILGTDPIHMDVGSGNAPPSSSAFPRSGAPASRQESWSSSSYRPPSPPRGPRADRYPPPPPLPPSTASSNLSTYLPSSSTSNYQDDGRYQNRSLYSSYERDNHSSGRTSPPSAPRYSERRYSPSQPVLQDTWSPIPASRDSLSRPTYFEPQTSISHAQSSTHANPRISDRVEVDAQHIVLGSTPPMPEPQLAQPGPSRPQPSWVTNQQRSSPVPNGTIAESSSNLQPVVPEVKKMKFKPRVPGKKDKGKQREDLPSQTPLPVNVNVKTEPPAPEPEPAVDTVTDNVALPVIANGYEQGEMQTQTQQDNGDVSMEDVKPDIRALEKMDVDVDVRDADWVQKEGVLAVNKRDLHPSCFSKDVAKRKRARDKLKENKMRVLEVQGRAITYTHWRDDGVAFDWRLVSNMGVIGGAKEEAEGDEEDVAELKEVEKPQPAQLVKVIPVKVTHLQRESEQPSLTARDSPNRRSSPASSSSESSIDQPLAAHSRAGNTAVPSAEATNDANLPSINEQSLSVPATPEVSSMVSTDRPASTTMVDTLSFRDDANQAPISLDQFNRPSAHTGLRFPDSAINPRYNEHGATFLIAYPPQFGTKGRRAASNAEFEEWMEEQRRAAAQMNDEEQYSTRVFYVDKIDSIGITIKAINPSILDTWPDSHFTHERIIAFPQEWQTPEQRETEKGKVRKWIENYCKEVSEPDQQRRPTRWVRADRRRSTVIFRWKLKTKEEIEGKVPPPTGVKSTSPQKGSMQLVRGLVPLRNAENVQHDDKRMTFSISYPSQFADTQKRNPLAFKKWKEQQKHMASMPDEHGRPTYIVSHRTLEKLYVRVLSYDPEDTSTWSSDGFDHQLEVRYPQKWQDPKFRHTDKKAFNLWVQEQITDVSLNDHLGRSPYWVKATKSNSTLELRWRKKTKEELESGRGRIVDTSEGLTTANLAQSSNDNPESSSRTRDDRLDKGKAKVIDPDPSGNNQRQKSTTTLAYVGSENANRNAIAQVSISSETDQGKDAKKKEWNGSKGQIYDHEEIFAFPSRWEDRREQERDKVALDQWVRGQARIVSAPDGNGQPSRWIKVIKRDTDILIRWKAKGDDARTNSLIKAPSISVAKASISSPAKKSKKRAREADATADAEAEMINGRTSTLTPALSQDKDKIKIPKVKKGKSAVPPASNDGDDGSIRSQSRSISTSTSYSNLTTSQLTTISTATNGTSTSDRRPSNAQSISSNVETQPQPQPQTQPRPQPQPQIHIPEPSSAELDALNASLRAKVAQIERWTNLHAEFPDLRESLEGQIERTQEAIFGLHDAIRGEKERLRAALQ